MSAPACVVRVTVKPGAKAPGIILRGDGSIEVRVTERPVEGRATAAARASLAAALGVAKTSVTLLRGARGRLKTFSVEGLSEARARARLQEGVLARSKDSRVSPQRR